jgi:hypothetical protein
VIDQLDLAAVRLAQGQLAPAARLLREADTLAAEAGDPVGVAYAGELLGVVAAREGDPAGAGAHWAEAQARRPDPDVVGWTADAQPAAPATPRLAHCCPTVRGRGSGRPRGVARLPAKPPG